MASMRTYDYGCAAHTLDLVGERWALLVVRELAEAMRSGNVKIEGDESAVERFLTLFALPEPASPVAGA